MRWSYNFSPLFMLFLSFFFKTKAMTIHNDHRNSLFYVMLWWKSSVANRSTFAFYNLKLSSVICISADQPVLSWIMTKEAPVIRRPSDWILIDKRFQYTSYLRVSLYKRCRSETSQKAIIIHWRVITKSCTNRKISPESFDFHLPVSLIKTVQTWQSYNQWGK